MTDTFGGVVATGTGAATSDSKNVSVTVNAVNDPVTATAPANSTLAEDSSVAVTGLSIADVDATPAPSGIYSVTLGATHGTLTLSTVTGLSFDTGDGTADATMTFHGTLSAINTALATASYAGVANYNGSDTIAFSVTDTFGGVLATGTGSATSDSKNIAVTVTAVNDPVTANVPGALSVTEDTPAAVSGLSIADVDATLAPSGIYSVTLSGTHGTLTFGTLAGLAFDSGDGTADATMTFHGTLSAINTALATTSYSPDADYNGAAAITLSATDNVGGTVATGDPGSGTTDSHTLNFSISAVDDPPINHVPGAQTIAPNGVLTFSTTGGDAISVSDVDVNETAPANNTEQVTLSVSSGTLSLNGITGLAFTGGTGTGDTTMTFTGNLNDINTALNGLTYSAPASAGNATLTLTTSDLGHTGSGGPLTDTDTVSISVVSPLVLDLDANDSSGVTGSGYATVFTGTPVRVADNDVTITSTTNVASATVSITSHLVPSEDLLALINNPTTMGDIAGTYVPATGVLTLTTAGGASLLQWEAALAAVTYTDSLTSPNSASRGLDIVLTDTGSSVSNTAHTDIYFHGLDLDSTPGFDATGSFLEQTPIVIAPNATISGFDNLTSLTVTLAARPDGDGVESLFLDSTALSAATAAGLTVGYTAATGVLSITSASPVAESAYQSALDAVQYNDTSDNPTATARTVTVVVSDGTGSSAVRTDTISVTPLNDPPTAIADTGSAGENETKSFDVLANDTDLDTGDTKTLNSPLGVVTVASANGDVNGIDASGAFSVVGNQIKFTPATLFDQLSATDSATVVVNYTMHDSANATASSTLTLTVNGANDAPVANADTGSAGENETKSFDVLANDTDVDTGDTKTLSTTLTADAVTSANGDVNGIDASSAFSVVGNQIKFTPGTLFDHLAVGDSASVVVHYTMQDSANATASSTLTLTVNGANDPPTGVADTGSAGENETKSFDVLANGYRPRHRRQQDPEHDADGRPGDEQQRRHQRPRREHRLLGRRQPDQVHAGYAVRPSRCRRLRERRRPLHDARQPERHSVIDTDADRQRCERSTCREPRRGFRRRERDEIV